MEHPLAETQIYSLKMGGFYKVLGGCSQGSTKWLSQLSGITDTPVSQGNFSLEYTHGKPKKMDFWHKQFSVRDNKFLSQKQVSVTESGFCHRNNFLSEKEVSVT